MSKININKVFLNFQWSFNCFNTDCSICRNSIINVENELSVIGDCNHVYHENCVKQWLKTKNVCPLCNKIWKYKKKS